MTRGGFLRTALLLTAAGGAAALGAQTEQGKKLLNGDYNEAFFQQGLAITGLQDEYIAMKEKIEGLEQRFSAVETLANNLNEGYTKLKETVDGIQTWITETLPQQFKTWRDDIVATWSPRIETVAQTVNQIIEFFATPIREGFQWVQDRIEDIRTFVHDKLPFGNLLNWQVPQWQITLPTPLPIPKP